jgi:hypothetical protein
MPGIDIANPALTTLLRLDTTLASAATVLSFGGLILYFLSAVHLRGHDICRVKIFSYAPKPLSSSCLAHACLLM